MARRKERSGESTVDWMENKPPLYDSLGAVQLLPVQVSNDVYRRAGHRRILQSSIAKKPRIPNGIWKIDDHISRLLHLG